ncbi:hypothetical protein GGE56_004310 [Rhizobium leguminosarum]|uniref:Uncharacterized protein n=1 Tax=Rhizobium esperanzae TaxID=1967781 RepID=A0A7W6UNZ2_9HYPH|nr:hypothetical protein [Rhizobium leguminosarum]MBB4441600.1 hypothetical protein [Rhizobium esperanzae]MBB6295999.1 hypothetical protein [Rhizobium leguminosarum]
MIASEWQIELMRLSRTVDGAGGFYRSERNSRFVRRTMINGDMSLAVLGTDAGARSAADTAAGIINDHDHATELTIKVVLAIADTQHFACFIDTVGMHDLT